MSTTTQGPKTPLRIDVAGIMAATGRKYPDGYGFAARYMDAFKTWEHADLLREAANACVRHAYRRRGHYPLHDADIARYVIATTIGDAHNGVGISHPLQWWLIEGAQLVQETALAGGTPNALREECRRALAACGHLGYEP